MENIVSNNLPGDLFKEIPDEYSIEFSYLAQRRRRFPGMGRIGPLCQKVEIE
jgi:hypothetical protein